MQGRCTVGAEQVQSRCKAGAEQVQSASQADLGLLEARASEVDHLDGGLARVAEQDVLGLEVAVHDALGRYGGDIGEI